MVQSSDSDSLYLLLYLSEKERKRCGREREVEKGGEIWWFTLQMPMTARDGMAKISSQGLSSGTLCGWQGSNYFVLSPAAS